MQKTVMLLEWQERSKRPKMSIKLKRSSRRIEHRKMSRFMDDGGGIVRPTVKVRLGKRLIRATCKKSGKRGIPCGKCYSTYYKIKLLRFWLTY